MTARKLLADFKREFAQRHFAAGLILAFIGFVEELNAFGRYQSLDELLRDFPLSDITARGTRANTLTVTVATVGQAKPRLLSIRPAYNRAEAFFRVLNQRFDYPNCAPHATGQWRDYVRWLDAIVGLSAEEAAWVDASVRDWVLQKLESHEIDPLQLVPLERPFTQLLDGFNFSKEGREPAGAAFQGALYAYIRADAPHLHLEVAKAGAGSKRLGRVGDIDGWDGERLVLSVEVKHYRLDVGSVDQVKPFLRDVVRRNALSIVAAESFSDEAHAAISEEGGRCLDTPSLLALVDLWDPLKQRAAVQAYIYYVHHIEKNMLLMKRLAAFFAADGEDAES